MFNVDQNLTKSNKMKEQMLGIQLNGTKDSKANDLDNLKKNTIY